MHPGQTLALIYCPCPDQVTAQMLAQQCIHQGWAACANILPGVQTQYLWQDSLQEEQEVVLLLKTLSSHQEGCCSWLEDAHPYEVPAIVAWHAQANQAFLAYCINHLRSLTP